MDEETSTLWYIEQTESIVCAALSVLDKAAYNALHRGRRTTSAPALVSDLLHNWRTAVAVQEGAMSPRVPRKFRVTFCAM